MNASEKKDLTVSMVLLLWAMRIGFREIMGAIVWIILMAIVRANLVSSLPEYIGREGTIRGEYTKGEHKVRPYDGPQHRSKCPMCRQL